jgi:LEA14-like dessication related protein
MVLLQSKIFRFSALVSCILTLYACNAVKQIQDTATTIKSCKFSLVEVKPKVTLRSRRLSIRSFRRSNVNIGFYLTIEVKNPTQQDLSMNRMALDLYLDDLLVARGDIHKIVHLPAGQATIASAYLAVNPDVVSSKLVRRIRSRSASYRVDGTFYSKLLGLEIPVRVTLREGRIRR